MNIQDWFPLGWTGWISLQSKGLSRVFFNTTVQKHQFFSAQLSLWSNFKHADVNLIKLKVVTFGEVKRASHSFCYVRHYQRHPKSVLTRIQSDFRLPSSKTVRNKRPWFMCGPVFDKLLQQLKRTSTKGIVMWGNVPCLHPIHSFCNLVELLGFKEGIFTCPNCKFFLTMRFTV